MRKARSERIAITCSAILLLALLVPTGAYAQFGGLFSAILGTITDPKLPPNAVDLILLVDVYHEFDHPWEMTRAMVRGLKPGGRLVFVEYRLEDPDVQIKTVHKMSEKQVRKEMAIFPLRWVETNETMPWQHIIIFKKMAER